MTAPFTFRAPAGILARKPAHGAPCNRCGLCCIATLCDIGRTLFRQERGPCPALQWDGEESRCGILAEPNLPKPLADAAALLLYAGRGCDARFNGEPKNETFNATERAYEREHADELRQARDLWRVEPK
jgi:hypothetical protein